MALRKPRSAEDHREVLLSNKEEIKRLSRAEKLETQKGMRKRRKVTQRSGQIQREKAWDCVLMRSAAPMMPLRPAEVSQMRGVLSKWFKTLSVHQMK